MDFKGDKFSYNFLTKAS